MKICELGRKNISIFSGELQTVDMMFALGCACRRFLREGDNARLFWGVRWVRGTFVGLPKEL